MATVRDLLLQPPLPGGTATFHGLPGAGAPSLTHKNWVQPYPEVQLAQVQMNPDFDAINAVFGNEDSFDRHLQDTAVNPPNNTVEWFQSEGDSVRVFYTHISHPIQLAFQTPSGTPFVVQRSESGPLGPTNVSQTVDFTWGHGERCLLLGELKRHRIIDPGRWTGQLPADGNRTWLGKEIRAYCHKYKCFAASVFDGRHLLILVFQAQTVERIRAQNCPVIGFVFSRDCPTARYGLFRAVTHQIQRMQAAEAPAVALDGYVRRFRWWSGEPYWVNQDGNEEHGVHPNGYTRVFSSYGAWFWAHGDGTPVVTQDGQSVWDTVALGL